MYSGYITDIEGVKVGHAHSESGVTGVTTILCEDGCTAGVDVRGGAPGTRETDLLKSENMVDKVHGIVLSGGSAFGLDSCSGVMKYLEEREVGFDVGVARIPIVPGAVIFDLEIGNPKIRPDLAMGYEAAENATESENRQGCIGAGYGAAVGKILGMDYAVKSGLGSATLQIDALQVSALVVLNAFGDVYDYQNGKQVTGPLNPYKNGFLSTYHIMKSMSGALSFEGKNTTIAVVATNGDFSKTQMNKIAQMAHNGYAKSIHPVHTQLDGDTIFALSTNKVQTDINLVGTMASEAISQAISNAVEAAQSIGDIKSRSDLTILI